MQKLKYHLGCFSADCSIYNAFGRAFMSFMNALMTYEPQHISEASAIIGRACDTLDKFRHKVGFLPKDMPLAFSLNN